MYDALDDVLLLVNANLATKFAKSLDEINTLSKQLKDIQSKLKLTDNIEVKLPNPLEDINVQLSLERKEKN